MKVGGAYLAKFQFAKLGGANQNKIQSIKVGGAYLELKKVAKTQFLE